MFLLQALVALAEMYLNMDNLDACYQHCITILRHITNHEVATMVSLVNEEYLCPEMYLCVKLPACTLHDQSPREQLHDMVEVYFVTGFLYQVRLSCDNQLQQPLISVSDIPTSKCSAFACFAWGVTATFNFM